MTFAATRYKGPRVGCTFCAYLAPAQGNPVPAPRAKWVVMTRAGLREVCDEHRQAIEDAEKKKLNTRANIPDPAPST